MSPGHPGFAELGARSNFSLLDGASHPEELVLTAKAQGHAGIGLCDVNSLAGAVRGHVAAREAGLPYAVGARLVLEDGQHCLAWPVSRAGYGRLTRLLSAARMRGAKGEGRPTRQELLEHAQGWCLALIAPARPDAAFAARFAQDAAALRGALEGPLHCATAWRFDGRDAARLDHLEELARRAGGALLAAGDVRYHQPSRRRLADLLTAIRLGRTVDRLGRAAEPNAERHLRPLPEMQQLFARHPQALAHSLDILRATRGFSLAELRHDYPDEILEPGRTAQQTLEARVAEAAATRWPQGVPEDIARRLAHELRLIAQLDYAPYFLTVHEIVRFAQQKKILCQGRGSAANSSVCYVLGITAIDPSQHDLLFERFVSASRDEPPDIDVDFEHERREEVIQHIYQRYGRERAALVATVIRYRPRSALREVGKALGLSEDVTARLAKASWGPGRDLTLAEIARGEGLDPADRRLGLALELAEEIQDFPRHLATHVGGFVIAHGRLTETAVIGQAAMENRTVLEWDKDDIDALGLLKVDVLGLGMLSCLRRGLDLLARHHRRPMALHDIPQHCTETFAMLRRADSVGVFQVESRAQMNMLPRLKPEKFYDLVVQVAIVRPGPIQGDMVHPYLRRRDGLEKVTYPSPSPEHGDPDELKKVLGRTLGVPLFQEQAMRLAIVAAGFTPDEADRLRRAMATFRAPGTISLYREKLVNGMVRRGYEEDFAARVFAQIEGFGSYGFPESHAASFALLAYASAWLKRWHPAVFAAALLNSQPMGFYGPAQLVRDAREHGVEIRPIDVNASAWDCALEPAPASAEGLALRLGFRLAAGLGAEEGQRILEARAAGNGAPFASPEEVARRARLGRRAMEALARARAFEAMGIDRRAGLWAAQAVEDTALPLLRLAGEAAAAGEPPLLREPPPDLPAEREGQAMAQDYAATGLTLGRHPLAMLRPRLAAMGCIDSRDLARLRPGRLVRLAGLVLMRQRPGTSKGVIFVTLEDEFGTGNLVVWAELARRDRAALLGARLMLAEGRIERAEGEVPILHLLCRRLTDLTPLLDGLGRGDPETMAAPPGGSGPGAPGPGALPPLRLPPSRDFR